MKENNSIKLISRLLRTILKRKVYRKILIPKLDRHVRRKVIKNDTLGLPESVKLNKYYAIRSMYMSYFRNYDKSFISEKVTKKILETLVDSVMTDHEKVQNSINKFQSKYNQLPPKFMTISPTKKCNLNCAGCYASSKATDNESLSWTLLNKIIEDAYANMGMRFFVISGGEPMLYKSEGKTILDLANKFNDCFFLMYTNGTLISEEIALQMASAGNITPAISIEGSRSYTDNRRGKGVYEKILNATDYLSEKGVPFGLSVTATNENINLLLNEKFYDFYFNEFGATYMWVFQYMPIGRKFTTDLMITPEQRVELFKIQKKVLMENKFFVADFWNSAMLSNGCISCGKPKGYFYINWDGNIMPCVFVPHFIDNVQTLYNSGRNLSDALFSPFFVEGRKWQSTYLQSDDKLGNLLMPCFYRDHHKDFVEIAKSTGAKPENQSAGEALNSNEYYEAMLRFDEKLEKVASPVWEECTSQNGGNHK